jgi:lysophospholipase L1-like esterase
MPPSSRTVPLLACWLGLAIGLAGCADGRPAAEPDPTVATDVDGSPTVRPELQEDADSVLVLGDSLANGARLFGDLGDRLDAAGFDSLEILAEDGEDTEWAIAQIERRDEVPEVVVVELGTNPDAEPEGFDDAVRRLVALLQERGAERIAWVTPVHGRDDRYDEKVLILHGIAGIDRVADWAAEVRSDPRRLAADGLHPTEEGYRDLARFLVTTASSLASIAG